MSSSAARRTRFKLGFGLLILLLWTIGFDFSVPLHAGQARTTNDGVYTAAQAVRGLTVYNTRCAICHGEALAGQVGPPLTGNEFMGVWGGHPMSELVDKIEKTMPQDDPGTTTRAQAADLAAYILQVGKFKAGD